MEQVVAIATVALAVLTGILVVITGIYAHLTKKLVKATNTPEIEVDIRGEEAHINMLRLCIENVGTGIARDIQFNEDINLKIKELGLKGTERIEYYGDLKHGINHLAPGKKVEIFLGSVLGVFDDLKTKTLEITVIYADSVRSKRKYKGEFCFDFSQFEGRSGSKPPLYKIADAAEKIQKDLRSIPHMFRTHTAEIVDALSQLRQEQSLESPSFYRLGRDFSESGDHAKAIESFTRAIELSADSAEAYLHRGMSYAAIDDLSRAIEDYTRAIELKPDYADAYYNRGSAWLRLDKPAIGKLDLQNARDMGSEDMINLDRILKDYESVWK